MFLSVGVAVEGQGHESATEKGRREAAVTDHGAATENENTGREVGREIGITRANRHRRRHGHTETGTERGTGIGNASTAAADDTRGRCYTGNGGVHGMT